MTVTIQIIGVEDLESPRRKGKPDTHNGPPRDVLRFYGRRVTDMANRLVMFLLPMKEAAELMTETADAGDFPEVEIDDKRWAYVAAVGAGEARFRKEKPDVPPSG